MEKRKNRIISDTPKENVPPIFSLNITKIKIIFALVFLFIQCTYVICYLFPRKNKYLFRGPFFYFASGSFILRRREQSRMGDLRSTVHSL